ncbi:phytochelatin synthase family protein [Variovorax sp. KK3]|uniref:phytochelatin synthase family protein n=1 Tax=Variovorax sp. KK3 TaxID=1855728 RepID=UPI00097C78A5|nr:phytochelatin synthase family protein [Variovorax sp. KK3]
MNTLTRFALALLSAAILGCQSAPPPPTAASTPPIDAPAAQAALLPFASDEGLRRLASADAKRNFAALANQFEAQINGTFCGPTTAAIVLNAVHTRSADLPRDRERLRDGDLKNLPPGADLIVPRYTQDNVIPKGAKTRAQVLGEPMLINGQSKRDFGYQLRQFDEMLRGNGLVTRAVVVDDRMPEATIRAELIAALNRPDTYAVINYRREAVGQKGGGHISPLGAYDKGSDSFLVLDVNPAAASWVWMPTATLVRGMRTFDTLENRGYVIVSVR